MPSPKSQDANLERNRSLFLLIGYVVALSFFYIVLEWRSGGTYLFFDEDEYVFREDFVPVTWEIPEEEELPPIVEEDIEVPNEDIEILEEDIELPVPEIEPTVSNEAQIIHSDSTLRLAKTSIEGNKQTSSNETNRQVLDRLPEFPGGIAALRRYIHQNLIYPYDAIKANIEGTVLCSFIITEEGKISDLQIIEGKTPEMNAEATRVILQMPKWKPGMKNNQPTSVHYVMPIVFRLK